MPLIFHVNYIYMVLLDIEIPIFQILSLLVNGSIFKKGFVPRFLYIEYKMKTFNFYGNQECSNINIAVFFMIELLNYLFESDEE